MLLFLYVDLDSIFNYDFFYIQMMHYMRMKILISGYQKIITVLLSYAAV